MPRLHPVVDDGRVQRAEVDPVDEISVGVQTHQARGLAVAAAPHPIADDEVRAGGSVICATIVVLRSTVELRGRHHDHHVVGHSRGLNDVEEVSDSPIQRAHESGVAFALSFVGIEVDVAVHVDDPGVHAGGDQCARQSELTL